MCHLAFPLPDVPPWSSHRAASEGEEGLTGVTSFQGPEIGTNVPGHWVLHLVEFSKNSSVAALSITVSFSLLPKRKLSGGRVSTEEGAMHSWVLTKLLGVGLIALPPLTKQPEGVMIWAGTIGCHQAGGWGLEGQDVSLSFWCSQMKWLSKEAKDSV